MLGGGGVFFELLWHGLDVRGLPGLVIQCLECCETVWREYTNKRGSSAFALGFVLHLNLNHIADFIMVIPCKLCIYTRVPGWTAARNTNISRF